MALISSKELELRTDSKIVGNKWRVEEIYICKHGEQKIIRENGWMCYGGIVVCKCCSVGHCLGNEICEFCGGSPPNYGVDLKRLKRTKKIFKNIDC